MKRTLGRLALVLLGGSLGFLLAFQLIGSRVDANGVLREPFVLLPTSVGLATASLATGVGALLWRPSSRPR